VSDPARERAARERDDYFEITELAVDAGGSDPYEYRMGARDAVLAARWAAAADPSDTRIGSALRLAGELTVAVLTSIRSDGETSLEIGGSIRPVVPGLPAEALSGEQWANGLWAATAAGDAASAVRLAVLREAPPGESHEDESLLAAALATWWRNGSDLGSRLIDALVATDPDGRADGDRLLEIAVPLIRVFRHLFADDDEALMAAISDAAARHRAFHRASSGVDRPEQYLSLPLTGLVVLARELSRAVPPDIDVVPDGVLRSSRSQIACAVCGQPLKSAEVVCHWCDADTTVDAPLETSIGELAAGSPTRCPTCSTENRATALRCYSCSASLLPD